MYEKFQISMKGWFDHQIMDHNTNPGSTSAGSGRGYNTTFGNLTAIGGGAGWGDDHPGTPGGSGGAASDNANSIGGNGIQQFYFKLLFIYKNVRKGYQYCY